MATLDRVIQMQQQGLSTDQIIQTLRGEGVPPQEINDSLNQAQIKSAVADQNEYQQQMATQDPNQQAGQMQTPEPGPEASFNTEGAQAPSLPNMQAPAPGNPQVYEAPLPQDPNQGYYAPSPQAYSGQEYYMPGGTDTDMISEIAEQVALEKTSEMRREVKELATFKNAAEDKIKDIDDRLKRIESSIDKLNQAVIGKIGEFGENAALIHKDLNNLHSTVSKVMDSAIDHHRKKK